MRPFITRGPPAAVSDVRDGDLHQMIDDGCPLVLDPVGWDDDWRDNLGELDTFTDEACLAVGPTNAT
jgi:hypothetical protein